MNTVTSRVSARKLRLFILKPPKHPPTAQTTLNPSLSNEASAKSGFLPPIIEINQNTKPTEKDVLCNGADFPCSGKSGGNGAGTRVSDGTGWVKVNLSSQKAVSLPTLPVDPVNDPAYHYTYCADETGWEINTTLESDQLSYKMAADGGNEADKYEVGSNYLLLASGGGVCEF